MKKISILIALIALVMPCTAFCTPSDELAASVLNDLNRRDENKLVNIAYSLTETAKGHETLYRVTLDKDGKERRVLVARDGKAASSEDIADYEKKQDAREKKGEGDSVSVDKLADLIEPGSLKFESSDDKYAHFSFIYAMKSAKGVSQKMAGTLDYDIAGDYVSKISIANDKPFKPASTAKVSIFVMTLLFEKNAALDEIVPSSVHSHIKGRALLVMSFDEESDVTFSDFSRVN